MVARISHGRDIAGVLFYNKLKVDGKTGRILLCHGMTVSPRDAAFDIRRCIDDFRPYTDPPSRMKEKIFHVSLNPHPDDQLDEARLCDIATHYMEGMGYGAQPYIVYLHEDIDRHHLHIVSVRKRLDGSTVPYYREHERSVAVTEEIERIWGLVPAKSVEEQTRFEELQKVVYPRGEVRRQIASVVRNLLDRYAFCSLSELNTLLKLFNVSLEACRGEAAGRSYAGIIYGALDDRGERVGKPVKASRIGRDVGYRTLQRRCAATARWLSLSREAMDPARRVIREAMVRARSAEEFARMIRPHGLSVVFNRSGQGAGRIYGVTFIDHGQGVVIKGSRLDRDFSANRFQRKFGPEALSELSVRQVRSDIGEAHRRGGVPPVFALLEDLFGERPDSILEENLYTEYYRREEHRPRKKKRKRHNL